MTSVAEMLDAFGAGLYLLFGAMHLDLWLRRRDRIGYLWLAGASGAALAVDLTGMLLRYEQPGLAAGWVAINTLAVAAATFCIYELVVALDQRPAGAFARLLQGIALVSAPATPYFDLPVWLTLGSCGALLVTGMLRAFVTGRRGDPDSQLVARGFLVLVLCLLADIAMAFGWLPTVPSLPLFGFAALFLASARSLSNRFDRDYRELGELRRELEQRIAERTRELEAANAQLAEVSRTDSLTGVLNRRGFLERAEVEFERSRRGRRPIAVLLADVDHFKQLNDRLGHGAGDAALERLAGLLRASLRSQDLVARWGGEEFILLLPETDLHGAEKVAESVRERVASDRFPFEGEEIAITLSLGVAEHRLERTLDATVARADGALYSAKAAGRNRVVVDRATPPAASS